MINLNESTKIGKELGIDFSKIDRKEFNKGINVEMEHGSKIPVSNITNDDLKMTGKIALAHLIEYPDYYQRLDKMEKEADNYWKNKIRPNFMKENNKIFIYLLLILVIIVISIFIFKEILS
jgi:hypothetical protein